MVQGSLLLVDDDVFTARMMELQLTKAGHEVRSVSGGRAALEAMDTAPPDLVLTDLVMPEMSGLELVREIRARADGQTVPILILSGMDQSATIVEALRAGADDFIPKTKEHQLVLAKIGSALELAASKRAGSAPARGSGDAPGSWSIARGEVQYSSRWKAMLGFAPDEIGKGLNEWLDRIHPEDRDRVEQALNDHRSRATAHFEADFRIRHKDGHWLAAHAFGLALFGKDGQAARMVGSLALTADDGFRAKLCAALDHAAEAEDLETMRARLRSVMAQLA